MRNILGSFLRLYARPDVSVRLVFATPSGERHEIAALGAAMLAASSGLGVAYLGPDLPARDIVESVKPAGAQVLVLGLTTASAGKATERELRTIVRAKYLIDAQGLNKVQGRPFAVQEVITAIHQQLGLATNGQPAKEGLGAAVAELAGAADQGG